MLRASTAAHAASGRHGQPMIVLGLCCLAAAAALCAWALLRPEPTEDQTEVAWAELAVHIESVRGSQEADSATAPTAVSEEPLPLWESPVSGRCYVVMLEVRRAGVSVPVLSGRDDSFPFWISGSRRANDLAFAVPEASACAAALGSLELGDEIQLTTVDGHTLLYGVSAKGDDTTPGDDLMLLLTDGSGEVTAIVSAHLVW